MATANIKAVITAEDRASQSLKGFGNNAGDTMKKVGLATAAVGAALTLVAKKATDFTKDYVKDSKDLARQIGGSTEESSRLLYVTKRLGLEADQTQAMFGIFSKKISAAKDATSGAGAEQTKLTLSIEKTKLEINKTNAEIQKHGDKTGELGLKVRTLTAKLHEQQGQLSETRSAFDKIGVSVLDAQGKQKGFTQILLETADKFKGMQNGSEKSALAMELFGRSGKDLLPVLNLGSKGIADLEKNADKLGLTLNAKTIGAVSRYIESQKNLKDSTDAMKLAIGTATAPVLTSFNTKLNEIVTSLLKTDGPMKTVTTDILAFGGPITTVAGGALSLAGSISQINLQTVAASARFGAFGVAAAAATGGIAYLETSIFRTAASTGSVTAAFTSWQGRVLSTTLSMGQAVPVIGSVVTGLVSLGGVVFQNEQRQRALSSAHDATTAAQGRAKQAADILSGANLNLQGANLAVEGAQRAYNDAVARYGPKSFEARQANFNLQQANLGVKSATDQAKDATDRKAKADAEFAKRKEAENRLREQARAASENQGAFDRAAGAVAGFIRNLLNIPSKINNPKPASGGGGGGGGGGGFAYGGFTGRGGQSQVAGLVHKGEYVIPKSAVDQTTGMPKVNIPGGSPQAVNITIQAGAYMGSQQEARKYAKMIVDAYNDYLGMNGVSSGVVST